jgi:hypothetical protein
MTTELLSRSWLGSRHGIGAEGVDLMRRQGRLLGVRPEGAREDLFPTWQFGPDGRPLPGLQRVIAVARERGVGEERLLELLTARVGLGGRRRLVDALREGKVEFVVQTVRAARP